MHPAGGRADVGHGAGGRWSLVLTYGVGGYADGGHHFSGFRPRRSTRGGEKQRGGDGKQLSVNGEPDGDQEEWIDGLRRYEPWRLSGSFSKSQHVMEKGEGTGIFVENERRWIRG